MLTNSNISEAESRKRIDVKCIRIRNSIEISSIIETPVKRHI